MSTLSQFAPFAGGGLKSFQTGYVRTSSVSSGSFPEDNIYVDISVSAVSTSKTITGFEGSWGNTNYDAGGGIFPGTLYSQTSFPTTRMVATTVIRIGQARPTGSQQISGRWKVVEAN